MVTGGRGVYGRLVPGLVTEEGHVTDHVTLRHPPWAVCVRGLT